MILNDFDPVKAPRKDYKVLELGFGAVNKKKHKRHSSRFTVLNKAGIEIVDPIAWFNAFAKNQNYYDHMLSFFNARTDQEKKEICKTFKDPDGRCFQGMAQMKTHITNFDQDDFEKWKTFL